MPVLGERDIELLSNSGGPQSIAVGHRMNMFIFKWLNQNDIDIIQYMNNTLNKIMNNEKLMMNNEKVMNIDRLVNN